MSARSAGAMDGIRGEICAMAVGSEELLRLAGEGFSRFRAENLQCAIDRAAATAGEAERLTGALVELSKKEMTRAGPALHSCIAVIHEIKLIADGIADFSASAQAQRREGLLFSDTAFEEMSALHTDVCALMHEAVCALRESDGKALRAISERGEAVRNSVEHSSREHEKRLTSGACEVRNSIVFLDMVDALRRIADHAVRLCRRCS